MLLPYIKTRWTGNVRGAARFPLRLPSCRLSRGDGPSRKVNSLACGEVECDQGLLHPGGWQGQAYPSMNAPAFTSIAGRCGVVIAPELQRLEVPTQDPRCESPWSYVACTLETVGAGC